ncbi:MAG: T9SS type A sorting domain-containing protein [Bacteroides sp.]|nr:T9SS type A sorting domain-containing protein [Bacteroides sp.]
MRRYIITAIMSFVTVAGAVAAPVSKNEAIHSAKKFLEGRGIISQLHEVSSRSRAGEADQAYHIFNIGNNDGFVIIAGDDRARNVLAYSDLGSIDPASMPEACSAWLAQYAGEISSLTASDIAATGNDDIYSTEVISPLLPCKWDQGTPYNYDCPIDPTTGKRCVTGCVATAVAQIMYYYRYPERGVGSVSYDDKGTIRSIDFADYPAFDWDGMHDTYTSTTTEAEAAPVASLMKAVGYASKMAYTSDVSGAQHLVAGLAMINNFGYDKNMHRYERSRMTDEEWNDILISDLKAGHPVLYTGRNPEGAHAFVCDGYDGKGYYHINWGWGGKSDGYFALSALTPPTQSIGGTGSGYSLGQQILTNIAPAGNADDKPQQEGLMSLYELYYRDGTDFHKSSTTPVLTSSLEDARLFIYAYNRGMGEFSGDICVADLTDGTMRPMMTQQVYFLNVDDFTGISFNIADIPGMTDGTYKVGFYYRANTSDQWYPILPSTIDNPSTCTVTVNGSNVTFTSIYPDNTLRLVSAPVFTPLYSIGKQTWQFSVENDGNTRFEGYTGIAFINAAGQYTTIFTPTVCSSGSTTDIEITNTLSSLVSGTYKVAPFFTTSSDPKADNITLLAEPVDVDIYTIVLLSTTGNYMVIDGNTSSLGLSIRNIGRIKWQSSLEGKIFAEDGTPLSGRIYTDQLTVDKDQSLQVSLMTEGLDLKRGSYNVSFSPANAPETVLATFPLIVMDDYSALGEISAENTGIAVAPGSVTVTSPVAIAAISIHDMSGRMILTRQVDDNTITVGTENLADGIYILSVKTTDGNQTAKKIIIKH